MKNQTLTCSLVLLINLVWAQTSLSSFSYEASEKFPFGRLNPEAAPQTADYAKLIGLNDCKSVTRKADQTWNTDTVDVIWRFKYFMNGMAVQDETLKSDGIHNSSIRQYDPDSSKWYVTFFSSAKASAKPSTWRGGKVGKEIILYNKQKAINGMEGYYKITFHDITSKGFNWKGEWVNEEETLIFPTWYLFCKKRE